MWFGYILYHFSDNAALLSSSTLNYTFHRSRQFQSLSRDIIPDFFASVSRGRVHPFHSPSRPGHRPGRIPRWWHCGDLICHLSVRNKTISSRDTYSLISVFSGARDAYQRVKPADVTNYKQKSPPGTLIWKLSFSLHLFLHLGECSCEHHHPHVSQVSFALVFIWQN